MTDTDTPSTDDRLAALEAAVEELHDENAQLRDRVDALETEVNTLHDERDQLEDRVDHLQRENSTLRGQLSDLDDIDERVTALESRPHLDWNTKEFDDATIVRPEKANYPIGRALTTRPQWDEVESEIDNILEMFDAGEQTDHQNGARLRVAPETPL
jgi:cell division protein FtsB